MQGYIDHGTLAGTIGNPTEEVVNAIYKALPTDLQQIAQAPGGNTEPAEQEDPPAAVVFTAAEKIRKSIDAIREDIDNPEGVESAKRGTGNDDSHVRALAVLDQLETEIGCWA